MHRFDRTRVLAGFVLVAFLTASGCGYRSQLGDSRASSPSRGSESTTNDGTRERPSARIAVVALRNDSPEPWLDRILMDAMRREISARAGFDIVNDPHRADLVLRGRIRPLDVRSKSFSRFVSALEYAVTLGLDLEVVLASGNIVRLDSRTLSESDVYLASADIEVTRTNRLEVLRRLSDLLASRVADSIELIDSPIPEGDTGGSG